jgi:hypothetical protein
MKKDPANFANYRNGPHTITPKFLTLFYNAWGDELDQLKKKEKEEHPNAIENLNEESDYSLQNDNDAHIRSLEKITLFCKSTPTTYSIPLTI